MADVNRGNRPLSPHLQIYKLPMAGKTSILNRISAQVTVAGLVLIVLWLVGIAAGGRAFALADGLVRSWFGFIVLLLACAALWFHFLAGLRHFMYDAGIGLEKKQAHKSSWAIIIGTGVLTLISLILFIV